MNRNARARTHREIWWNDHSTVISLAYWLESNDKFDKRDDVINYFEKPWKWEDEFFDWKATFINGDFKLGKLG
jgi:hypothetical protein